MKKAILTAFALLCGVTAFAEKTGDELPEIDSLSIVRLDSIVVRATRARETAPVTCSTVERERLRAAGTTVSLPMALSMQPSVVALTEGGSGLGNTKLRVRGSDGSRINVTLNGVTLNDAESQEVFWVNIPSLTHYLESVQLQRGVGTSEGGSGAFGASVNMQTSRPAAKPHAYVELGSGSFSMASLLASVGSGRSAKGFSLDAVFSLGHTGGYIHNGWADVASALVTAGWAGENDALRFNWLFGKQHSGITWLGTPKEMLPVDRRYNPAGEYVDDNGRTCYYDNESDNYVQNHFQFIYTHQFTPNLSMNATLHLTPGSGYYEQYRGDLAFPGEFVVQQKERSTLTVTNLSLHWGGSGLEVDGGVSLNFYRSAQQGDIIYSRYASDFGPGDVWYTNNGRKDDASAFLRAQWEPMDGLSLYSDLQYRLIRYRINGADDDFAPLDCSLDYGFFNPKLGVNLRTGRRSSVYASVAVSHKEAARDDVKAAFKSAAGQSILPERLADFETGWRYAGEQLSASANLFAMLYKDQLVATGRLSSAGYSIKENVARSSRVGMEMQAEWRPASLLFLRAACALSRNRIEAYRAYVDHYDSEFSFLGQVTEDYEDVPLVMSPSAVASAEALVFPLEDMEAGFSSRYVSRQYYDNTGSLGRSLDPYLVCGAHASYLLKFKKGLTAGVSSMKMTIFVDNLFDSLYVADAWVYRALVDGAGEYVSDGLFPQACRNFSVKLTYNF